MSFRGIRTSGLTLASWTYRQLILPFAPFLATCATVWYLWGPPFGQGPSNSPVDYHEVVHWKGIQASLDGSLPYVGAGSSQYGPLTQLTQILLLKYVFEPSVETIRLSTYVIHFAALLFFVGVAFLFMERLSAVLAVFSASLLYPAFSFFRFSNEGLIGYWGWANIWRYSGLFLLGAGIPWLINQREGQARNIAAKLLGCAWAFTALMGQESLIGGGIVLATIGLVATCSRIISLKSWLSTFGRISFAALICCAVYLTPYIVVGQTGPFIKNYFLVPRAVASGYSNTPWWEQSTWSVVYRVAPLVSSFLLLLLATVGSIKRWSDERTQPSKQLWLTAFSLGVATNVAQAGSLTRADSTHLFNAYILFPFFVVAAVVYLSSSIERTMLRQTMRLGVVGLVALLFVMPDNYYWITSNGLTDRLTSPIKGRQMLESRETASNPDSVTRNRMRGVVLESENRFFNSAGITIAEVEQLSAMLRSAVGRRSTYLDPAMGETVGFPNAWYFLADIQPHTVPYEEQSLVISESEAFANREALIAHPPEAYITMDPNSSFSIDVWSRMRVVESFEILWLDNHRLFVFLASDTTEEQ